MLAIRSFVVVAVLSLGLAAAPGARAGVQQYDGDWIVQGFGNDNTAGEGGQTESDQWEMLGVPLGHLCNAVAPFCTFSRTGATVSTPTSLASPLTAKQRDPLAAFCVPNTAFGQPPTRPAKGATPKTTGGAARPIPPVYRNPAHFTSGGAGKTTACSDASTVLGGKATTFKLTTNDPRRGVGMKGAPVSGYGYLTSTSGSDPRAFSFAAAPSTGTGGMRRTVTGSFSNFAPYLYSYTYAALRNGPGYFSKGGGFFSTGVTTTSTLSFPYKKGGGTVGKAVIKKGANTFGGVMRLLGKMTNKVCYFRNGGCSLGQHNWRYDAIGTSGAKAGGVLTAPYKVTYTANYYHTQLMQVSAVMAVGSRFPWTTGTVTVTATGRGPNNTIEQRKGFDTRVSGVGRVQLVSPVITKWLQPSVNFETSGIALLRLRFVPEPETWMLLVAGLSTLGVLYRVRGR